MLARLTTRRSVVWLLYGIAVAASAATATDPDLFWHLRTGEFIVNHGIPSTDIFSFTVPGRAWVAHEWGSQVILWLLWQAGGSTMLILSFTALVVGVYAIAARTSTAGALPTAWLVALAALTARLTTAPRPQMFNLLGLAVMILLFERIRSGRLSPRWVWAAPAIILVWANLHSGYLVGVAVIVVYGVGERIERRRGNAALPAAAIGSLPLVAAAAFAAAALNPNGFAMWTYPIETLRSDAMQRNIQEWHSPDFHSPALWPFLALLALAVASLVLSRTRPIPTHALLLLGTGIAGLQSMRHIALFAVVAIPFVAPHLEDAWSLLRKEPSTLAAGLGRSRPVALLTAVLSLVVAAMFVAGAVGNNDRVLAEYYPVDAVDSILTSDLADARGFNSYTWGGYMIWRDMSVFIDGRADVYGDEFVERYVDVAGAKEGWRDLLDEYDVEYVLLEKGTALGTVLDESTAWVPVYRDDLAEVFTRCPTGAGCADPAAVAAALGLPAPR